MNRSKMNQNKMKQNTLRTKDVEKKTDPTKTATSRPTTPRGATSRGGSVRKKNNFLKMYSKIKSKTDNVWRILGHIGSGGFGDVYKVEKDSDPGKFYAMKTEMHNAKMARLRVELQILAEITEYCVKNKTARHFCELMDSGNTVDFVWIVMTLIGPSLDSVRRLLRKQFSKTTVLKMSLQILSALKILHDVGFIHRDLKPANVCVGVPPSDDSALYLLDFGISRRIYRSAKKRELRKERKKVPFFGTRKFCTRACHQELDQGRKDDVETWIYTTLDLLHNEKGLPWAATLGDHKKIMQKKVALFENPAKELHTCIPKQFATIIQYVGTLKFGDDVDYRLIEDEVKGVAKEKNLNLDEEFDWNGKLARLVEEKDKSKPKAKIEKNDKEKGEETLMMERLQKKLKNSKITDAHANDKTFSRDDYVSEEKLKTTETGRLRRRRNGTRNALATETVTKQTTQE